MDNVTRGIERLRIDICGLSEIRGDQSGEINTNNSLYILSGDPSGHRGVGFVVSNKLRKSILGYNTLSGRLATLRLKATPVNITLIRLYAPTLDKDDALHDEF